ncbi:MAG: type II toxin-antitoxin system VapC family toxin [Actinobacteria bacterium]|nr:type II toxin-antitoxin system VapC family toxin [Actinomycetota bacterium]
MNLLVDTQVALWALASPDRIVPEVREMLRDPARAAHVSAVTVWEVEIKRAIGKLTAPDGFAGECIERGFDPLPIDLAHAERAGRLPPHHADPFDRMLIAQALEEDLILVSDDRVLGAYDVRTIPASRS